MSGYYVRRQGDDSDYFEHSLLSNVRSKAHKYLAKLPTPGGGFRYIYDQAELMAARAGKAVSNVRRAADNVIGFGARKRWQSIHNRGERFSAKNQGASPRSSLQKQGQVAYNRYKKTLLGRAENAANAARNAIGNAVGEARRRGAGVVGSIKKGAYEVGRAADNAIGLTARRQFKSIHNRGERFSAKNQGASPRSSLQKQGQVAYNRYKNTLLGRAENAFNSARSKIGGAAGNVRNAASGAINKARGKGQEAINAAVGAGRGAAGQIRSAVGNAASTARKTAGNAASTVRKTAGNAASTVRKTAGNAARAVDNVVGVSAEREYRNARNGYFDLNSRSKNIDPNTVEGRLRAANLERRGKKLGNATRKYNKTLLGKANTGYHAARGTAYNVAGDISNAVDNARQRGKDVLKNVYLKTRKKKKA